MREGRRQRWRDAGITSRTDPVVYQLRVVLRGVSPLIWRRLLVRSDATVADLHRTLQVPSGAATSICIASSSRGGCMARTASSIHAAYGWLISACVFESTSCTNTTSSIAGSTTCGLNSYYSWTAEATRCASAADGLHHPRTVVAHGHSSSSGNATRQPASPTPC